MPFSKLFVTLVFGGIIPILVLAPFNRSIYAFLLYNAILFVVWLVDITISPKADEFEVTRICDEKFSMNAFNQVYLNLRNKSSKLVKISLVDTIPAYFSYETPGSAGRTVKLCIPAHYEGKGLYRIRPLKRGQYTFGNIHGRYLGVLGFCVNKAVFHTEAEYKVYPNLKDLRKYSLAAIKKSIQLSGLKKNRVYGIGTEFESLREYVQGDDYRKINWLATARTDKPIVNTYQPERNQQVFIMLDSSRVMNSEINNIKKLDYAINAAFLLADVAIRKGDNIGLTVFDNTVKKYVKPGKGPAHFHLLAENLYNVEENLVTADYAAAFDYVNTNHKRRSLFVIFTELFNSEETLQLVKAIRTHAKNHVCLIVAIKDERLADTADMVIRESSDVFTKGAAMKLVDERIKVKKILLDNGIGCLEAAPDKLSIEAVNQYLIMKDTIRF